MNAIQTFGHLRHLAKLKLAQDIVEVKQAYKERLTQIDAMERELCIAPRRDIPKRNARHAIRDAIIATIPADAIFTFDDLSTRLAESNINATIDYVRQVVRRMVKRGELKEVINRQSRLVKKYALPHVEAEEPLPALGVVVSEVLNASNAPMRPVEICVGLIEAGNALEGDPTESVALILRVLRDHPDRFCETDMGYWKTR